MSTANLNKCCGGGCRPVQRGEERVLWHRYGNKSPSQWRPSIKVNKVQSSDNNRWSRIGRRRRAHCAEANAVISINHFNGEAKTPKWKPIVLALEQRVTGTWLQTYSNYLTNTMHRSGECASQLPINHHCEIKHQSRILNRQIIKHESIGRKELANWRMEKMRLRGDHKSWIAKECPQLIVN